jgi:arginine deiminase
MAQAVTDSSTYAVNSEVGRLRKVLVCAPGLAHSRLTPSNCDELLFDDVLWVQNAKRDHFDFMSKMRDRGVEVVELHEVLAETMENPEAKSWLLDRKIIANEVGPGFINDTRAYLDSLDARSLTRFLIGGLATDDLPSDPGSATMSFAREALGGREYHSRHHMLDLRRCHDESALLARPSRRNIVDEGHLSVPPRLRGLKGLVGRP